MKQFTPVVKTIGNNRFYIRPFPAFTAAKMTGDLAGVAAPLLAAIAPLVVKKTGDGKKTLDADISEVAPAMSGAFSGFSGEKLEHLSTELLVAHGNISVSPGGDDSQNTQLTMDLANDLFCGEIDEMFMLMYEVIKVNFSGFSRRSPPNMGWAAKPRRRPGRLQQIRRPRPERLYRAGDEDVCPHQGTAGLHAGTQRGLYPR